MNNIFDLIHYIMIPKANHFVTLRFQIIRSVFIVLFLFQVLTPVQLDDDFFTRCAKVSDEWPNRMLSPKTDAIFTHQTKVSP